MTSSEAELTLGLLMNLVRRIPQAHVSVMAINGNVMDIDRTSFMGYEVQSKTLGILGLGKVGTNVATLAIAMGMKVLAYDPSFTQEGAESLGIRKVSLTELYALCDFLTFHAPITKKTRNMFNADALASCKDGVEVVVTAPVGLFDEDMLKEALLSGKMGGAALDALELDPLDTSFEPVLRHPSVLCTPNLGDSKQESVQRTYVDIAEKVCDGLDALSYDGISNAVFLPLSLRPEMTPFLELCTAMGKLTRQLALDPIVKIKVAAKGGKDIDISTSRATNLLLAAVTSGVVHGDTSLLSQAQKYVQAPLVAISRGIQPIMGECIPELKDWPLTNAVAVRVETTSGACHLVVGSVFGNEPRIVQLDNHRDFPAFKPEGTLVLFNNQDRPGAMTGILDVLFAANLNIAQLGLARQSDRSALGLLLLDERIDEKTVLSLQALESIHNIRTAHFGASSHA